MLKPVQRVLCWCIFAIFLLFGVEEIVYGIFLSSMVRYHPHHGFLGRAIISIGAGIGLIVLSVLLARELRKSRK
jgi:hypothetical protein